MRKEIVKGLTLVCFAGLIAGCAATEDIAVRRYIQEKERVDQEVQGTVGNWQNAPQATADPDRRPTRKVYVVEFSKEVDQDVEVEEIERMETRGGEQVEVQTTTRMRTSPTKMDLPSFDQSQGGTSSGTVAYREYTVEKNDTLQKISKKFYNSYSKWPRIYEVNRDVLKNPDSIKPGMVLKIPELN